MNNISLFVEHESPKHHNRLSMFHGTAKVMDDGEVYRVHAIGDYMETYDTVSNNPIASILTQLEVWKKLL
jgi:hypothetical protein